MERGWSGTLGKRVDGALIVSLSSDPAPNARRERSAPGSGDQRMNTSTLVDPEKNQRDTVIGLT
jgi:hypothetical protein